MSHLSVGIEGKVLLKGVIRGEEYPLKGEPPVNMQ